MRPTVLIVASHLQAHVKDCIHTQNMSSVQADSLHFPHLLQFLLHFLFHCSMKNKNKPNTLASPAFKQTLVCI